MTKHKCPGCGLVSDVKKPKQFYSDDAKSVLACLNRMSGKKYKNSKHSLQHIQARLDEGYSRDDCIKVLDIKIKDDWFRQNNNFNPQTLFRPSHFDKYLNEHQAPNTDQVLKTANEQAKSVLATIRKHGSNVTPGFANPLTKKVIEKHFKGWINACKSEERYFARNFVQAYVNISKGGL